jgi:glyoxylase-like metal-dependent hydrolase (beta-lactamase superfamily II)
MDAVERIAIPTPFDVGRVNCYLFTGNGLTILDPGPATETAYETLATHLNQRGHRIADIERVLITHPHMDHYGIARRLTEESGASVLAHTDATDRLADPVAYFDREQAFFRPFLVAMGLPAEMVDTVVQLPESYTDFREPVTVDRELDEGDIVDVGMDLTCVHTPGHAPGSLCYVASSGDIVFTGDHVLSDITPNPLLTLTPGTDDERTRSLPVYLESLRNIRSLEATVGYGGHRAPMQDFHDRVRETIEHHQGRKETIADMVASTEPTTAYDIMQELFPDLPVTEMFPGMSEVIGHLDLLEDEDRVEISPSENVMRYTLT